MQARTTLLLLAALALACCTAYASDDACKALKQARLAKCTTVKVDPSKAICVDYKTTVWAGKMRNSTGAGKMRNSTGAKMVRDPSTRRHSHDDSAKPSGSKSWGSSRRQGYAAGAACAVLSPTLPWGDATRSIASTTNMPCDAGINGKKTAVAWTTLSCCERPSEEERKCRAGAKTAKQADRTAKKAAKIAKKAARKAARAAAANTTTPGH